MEFETIDYRNSDTEDLKKKLRDKNTPTSMSKERIVLAVDEALAANKEAVDQFSTLTHPLEFIEMFGTHLARLYLFMS